MISDSAFRTIEASRCLRLRGLPLQVYLVSRLIWREAHPNSIDTNQAVLAERTKN